MLPTNQAMCLYYTKHLGVAASHCFNFLTLLIEFIVEISGKLFHIGLNILSWLSLLRPLRGLLQQYRKLKNIYKLLCTKHLTGE